LELENELLHRRQAAARLRREMRPARWASPSIPWPWRSRRSCSRPLSLDSSLSCGASWCGY